MQVTALDSLHGIKQAGLNLGLEAEGRRDGET